MKFAMRLAFALAMFAFVPAFACDDHAEGHGKQSTSAEMEKATKVAAVTERRCIDDTHCPPGSPCVNGRCELSGMCRADIDCPVGQKCVGGKCK